VDPSAEEVIEIWNSVFSHYRVKVGVDDDKVRVIMKLVRANPIREHR
jgi:alanyl-tRNA synthetase